MKLDSTELVCRFSIFLHRDTLNLETTVTNFALNIFYHSFVVITIENYCNVEWAGLAYLRLKRSTDTRIENKQICMF